MPPEDIEKYSLPKPPQIKERLKKISLDRIKVKKLSVGLSKSRQWQGDLGKKFVVNQQLMEHESCPTMSFNIYQSKLDIIEKQRKYEMDKIIKPLEILTRNPIKIKQTIDEYDQHCKSVHKAKLEHEIQTHTPIMISNMFNNDRILT